MKIHRIAVMALAVLMSCQPAKKEPAKAEATTVAAKNITGEEISYAADNITMKGFIAYDAAQTGKRPGVIVVHEWWGHNEYARQRAKMLAEMGYVALAVDMYGDGKKAEHPQDAGKFASETMKNFKGAKARFEKAVETLKNNPNVDASHIAAIGYCFGGGVVLNMARQGIDMKAVVSFHGSLGAAEPAKEGVVKSRVLVCNGAADKFVSEKDIEGFKKEMDAAKVNYAFKSYDGAVHGFTNPAVDSLGKKFNLPLAYNAKADADSWADMTALFKEVFGK